MVSRVPEVTRCYRRAIHKFAGDRSAALPLRRTLEVWHEHRHVDCGRRRHRRPALRRL